MCIHVYKIHTLKSWGIKPRKGGTTSFIWEPRLRATTTTTSSQQMPIIWTEQTNMFKTKVRLIMPALLYGIRSPVYSLTNQTFQGLSTIRAFRAEKVLERQFHARQNENTAAW
uniref:Uncharacterized protein n=1 Tax=Megaselia scalaris TaxID=36166 RepID=T1GRX9_MEGSC